MSMEERRRPYASPANVIAVLQRCRSRNLPDTIDNDFLRLAGLNDMVLGRVREALQFLGMLGPDGRPTDTLRALAAAPDEDYRTILAGAIREAYREDFERIDPARDGQAQINNAFRPYQPRSQTARMAILLLGLCREAGIPVLEAPRQRQMKSNLRPSVASRPRPAASPAPASSTTSGGTRYPSGYPMSSTQMLPEDEIAMLTDEEFEQVWKAIGLVARTRALAKRRAADAARPTPSAEDGGNASDERGEA